jgi:hypothetical protein
LFHEYLTVKLPVRITFPRPSQPRTEPTRHHRIKNPQILNVSIAHSHNGLLQAQRKQFGQNMVFACSGARAGGESRSQILSELPSGTKTVSPDEYSFQSAQRNRLRLVHRSMASLGSVVSSNHSLVPLLTVTARISTMSGHLRRHWVIYTSRTMSLSYWKQTSLSVISLGNSLPRNPLSGPGACPPGILLRSCSQNHLIKILVARTSRLMSAFLREINQMTGRGHFPGTLIDFLFVNVNDSPMTLIRSHALVELHKGKGNQGNQCQIIPDNDGVGDDPRILCPCTPSRVFPAP